MTCLSRSLRFPSISVFGFGLLARYIPISVYLGWKHIHTALKSKVLPSLRPTPLNGKERDQENKRRNRAGEREGKGRGFPSKSKQEGIKPSSDEPKDQEKLSSNSTDFSDSKNPLFPLASKRKPFVPLPCIPWYKGRRFIKSSSALKTGWGCVRRQYADAKDFRTSPLSLECLPP